MAIKSTACEVKNQMAGRVYGTPAPQVCDHPQFPLWPHQGRQQWCKKIQGCFRYFGSIALDPTGERAWKQYQAEKPFWEAGMDPRAVAGEQAEDKRVMSVLEICDRWLVHRRSQITTDDIEQKIEPRTYDEAAYAVRRFLAIVDEVAGRQSDPLQWPPPLWQKIREDLGRTADGRKVSPATKNIWIVNIRMMFAWARDYHLNALPRWGSAFKTVRKRLRQEHRFDFQREHGQRVFDAGAARKILDAVDAEAQRAGLNRNNTSGFAGVSQRPDGRFEAYIVRRRRTLRTKHHLGVFDTAEQAAAAHHQEAARMGASWHARMRVGALLFRACTHLAANTGAYSKDIASLTLDDLRYLDEAYLEAKRTKTAAIWQAVLWPETVQAVKEYLVVRPKPARPEWNDIVFLSANGYPVNLDSAKKGDDGQYAHTNRKDNLKARMARLLIGLGMKSKGLNFGAWRHTVRTFLACTMGIGTEAVMKIDAVNRMMGHEIPGSANNYVHLPRTALQPLSDGLRMQLWPDRLRPA